MDDAGRGPQQERASNTPLKAAGALTAENIAAEERLGPLQVSRYRKADGRALILYARVGASAEESLPSSIAPPGP